MLPITALRKISHIRSNSVRFVNARLIWPSSVAVCKILPMCCVFSSWCARLPILSWSLSAFHFIKFWHFPTLVKVRFYPHGPLSYCLACAFSHLFNVLQCGSLSLALSRPCSVFHKPCMVYHKLRYFLGLHFDYICSREYPRFSVLCSLPSWFPPFPGTVLPHQLFQNLGCIAMLAAFLPSCFVLHFLWGGTCWAIR